MEGEEGGERRGERRGGSGRREGKGITLIRATICQRTTHPRSKGKDVLGDHLLEAHGGPLCIINQFEALHNSENWKRENYIRMRCKRAKEEDVSMYL